ncbi:MAG: transporter, family, benzoate transport protein, partial [Clostridia bacterium]|nr:transporter, family, benzoate transport protein [Clostridia bacterium]
MRIINVKELIDDSKINRFHLLLFISCILIITCDGYDLVVYGTIVPILMKSWNLSPAVTGILGSYALIGALLGAIIFGTVADKIGKKRTAMICLIL